MANIDNEMLNVLDEMKATFIDRNGRYGGNYRRAGTTLAALFPNGLTLKTAEDFERFHLLDLVIGKLTRFSQTLDHKDSALDLANYAAMLAAWVSVKEKEA